METNIVDKFKKELGKESANLGVFGTEMAQTRKDFSPSLNEEEADSRESSVDYLKDGVSLKQIYELAKNKRLSNNKIKQEIRKLLKKSEELDDFLRSFIKKSENKEHMDSGVGNYTGPVSGVVGTRNEGETNEVTASGGGVGAYEAPLFGKLKEEKLKGGKSDGMTLNDIAKKHTKKNEKIDKIMSDLKIQFRKGMKIESEHTDDEDVASEIVMDHLYEDPYYYNNLQKIETKEATSTASSGAYEGPSIWAKTTSKKNWKPSRKTQIPGGKFVQVKKKCKRFPYCNQGDITALKLSENQTLNKVITSISEKYDLNRSLLEDIILFEMQKLNK